MDKKKRILAQSRKNIKNSYSEALQELEKTFPDFYFQDFLYQKLLTFIAKEFHNAIYPSYLEINPQKTEQIWKIYITNQMFISRFRYDIPTIEKQLVEALQNDLKLEQNLKNELSILIGKKIIIRPFYRPVDDSQRKNLPSKKYLEQVLNVEQLSEQEADKFLDDYLSKHE